MLEHFNFINIADVDSCQSDTPVECIHNNLCHGQQQFVKEKKKKRTS